MPPPTPLAISDFQNAEYSIGGVAKTFDDMFASPGGWIVFDPSMIVPDVGFTLTVDYTDDGTSRGFVASPALLAAIGSVVDGIVCLLDYTITVDDPGDVIPTASLVWIADDFSQDWTWKDEGPVFPGPPAGGINFDDDGTGGGRRFTADSIYGAHKTAILFSNANLACSQDGAAVTSTGAGGASDGSTFSSPNFELGIYSSSSTGAMPTAGSVTMTVRSATWFAVADVPDLSVLSATIATAAGIGAGIGAGLGVGASLASGLGSASGVGAASAAGTATASATGACAGLGAAIGAGWATAASAGSAVGLGAANATGAEVASADGNAVGAVAATAAGNAYVTGAGLSAGFGVVVGIGQSIAQADGSAAGVSDASAEGKGILPEPSPLARTTYAPKRLAA